MLTGIIPTLLGTLAQEKNGDQEVTPCRPNLLTMLLLEKENSAPKKNLLGMSLNQLFSKESFIFNMWMVNASVLQVATTLHVIGVCLMEMNKLSDEKEIW